ncbi:hypothetical protein [Streptomyces sp. JNUCC 63]
MSASHDVFVVADVRAAPPVRLMPPGPNRLPHAFAVSVTVAW